MSVWESYLHQASFGGVEFDCMTTDDSINRVLARHEFPRVDGGRVDDMGAEPRQTECQIIFFERPPREGEDHGVSEQNHIDRFFLFHEKAMAGRTQDFVHPITGTYPAKVEGYAFSADGEDEDVIVVRCTFVEDSTLPAIFDSGAGWLLDAGAAAVRAQADQAAKAMKEAGLDASLAADATTTVDSWTNDISLSVRAVNLGVATLAGKFQQAMDIYELATDINRFPAYRSMQALLWKVRQAGEAFRQSQPALITITLARSLPLRVIVTEHYGSSEHERRYEDVMRLNDIDDPGLIPEGTQLRAPAPRAA